jgi:hypothetical protein
VGAHVPLEVEVRELIRLSELEESSWERIAELEERVLALEQDLDDMPALVEDEQD